MVINKPLPPPHPVKPILKSGPGTTGGICIPNLTSGAHRKGVAWSVDCLKIVNSVLLWSFIQLSPLSVSRSASRSATSSTSSTHVHMAHDTLQAMSSPSAAVICWPHPGSPLAPMAFMGKSSKVEEFLSKYKHLCKELGVYADDDRCLNILQYCTGSEHTLIRGLEGFISFNWYGQLRSELMDVYGADEYRCLKLKQWARTWHIQSVLSLPAFEAMKSKFDAIVDPLLDHNSITFPELNEVFNVGLPPLLLKDQGRSTTSQGSSTTWQYDEVCTAAHRALSPDVPLRSLLQDLDMTCKDIKPYILAVVLLYCKGYNNNTLLGLLFNDTLPERELQARAIAVVASHPLKEQVDCPCTRHTSSRADFQDIHPTFTEPDIQDSSLHALTNSLEHPGPLSQVSLGGPSTGSLKGLDIPANTPKDQGGASGEEPDEILEKSYVILCHLFSRPRVNYLDNFLAHNLLTKLFGPSDAHKEVSRSEREHMIPYTIRSTATSLACMHKAKTDNSTSLQSDFGQSGSQLVACNTIPLSLESSMWIISAYIDISFDLSFSVPALLDPSSQPMLMLNVNSDDDEIWWSDLHLIVVPEQSSSTPCTMPTIRRPLRGGFLVLALHAPDVSSHLPSSKEWQNQCSSCHAALVRARNHLNHTELFDLFWSRIPI
jgi:hypothetical protein